MVDDGLDGSVLEFDGGCSREEKWGNSSSARFGPVAYYTLDHVQMGIWYVWTYWKINLSVWTSTNHVQTGKIFN